MRRQVGTLAVALSLTAGVVTAPGWAAFAGEPGQDGHPSRAEVRDARHAAQDKAAEVAGVQARLIDAQARVQQSQIRVAQAEEAFNAARWHFQEADRKARDAEATDAIASAQLEDVRNHYVDTITSSYEHTPSLSALAAMMRSHGIRDVIDRTSSYSNAQNALDFVYDDYTAASILAGVASQQAAQARAAADDLREQTRRARANARIAQRTAAAEAAAVAAERGGLIDQLAELQGISSALAEQRQEWLEKQAEPTPTPEPTPDPTPTPEPTPTAAPTSSAPTAAPTTKATPTAAPTPTPTTPTATPTPTPAATPTAPATTSSVPTPTPTPTPTATATPTPPPPPPASGGASAAIAFATAQIGDPYQWGAAGPDRWDCSGLTMRAWQAGGVALPHYSAGQYTASTPITQDQLQPGDLLFWGSSSSPSSIYHVALYVGGGEMIHAPRTGETVRRVPIDEWILPNFFARP